MCVVLLCIILREEHDHFPFTFSWILSPSKQDYHLIWLTYQKRSWERAVSGSRCEIIANMLNVLCLRKIFIWDLNEIKNRKLHEKLSSLSYAETQKFHLVLMNSLSFVFSLTSLECFKICACEGRLGVSHERGRWRFVDIVITFSTC